MMHVQYLTPYLISAYWYADQDLKTVHPVYVNDIDGYQVSLVCYNATKTEKVAEAAWYHIQQLKPYTVEARDNIQKELDSLWRGYY